MCVCVFVGVFLSFEWSVCVYVFWFLLDFFELPFGYRCCVVEYMFIRSGALRHVLLLYVSYIL